MQLNECAHTSYKLNLTLVKTRQGMFYTVLETCMVIVMVRVTVVRCFNMTEK